MRTVLAGVLATLFSSAGAGATTGLEWRWDEGTERRWLLRSEVDLAEALSVVDAEAEARLVRIVVGLVIRCRTTSSMGRNAWAVRCDVEDATVGALPTAETRGAAGTLVAAWAAALREKASIDLVLSRSGRVRGVELSGLDRTSERMQQVAGLQRDLLLRALAPLDVELPRRGDDRSGRWVQSEALAFGMPSAQPLVGVSGAQLTHTVASSREGRVTVHQQGEGGLGAARDAEPRLRLTLDGSAVFDTTRGALVASRFIARGEGGAYTHSAQLELLDGDESPTLGPTGLLEAPAGP